MNTNSEQTANLYVDAYFRHSIDIDLDSRSITVMAQLLFRNLSQAQLADPHIVLHINSPHASLSGKILSPELIRTFGVYTKGGQPNGWAFIDSDWFKNARTTGEYRIKSIEPLILKPGVWQEMKDWTVECSLDHLQEPLIIQGWIEVDQRRFAAINSISITCSM